MVAAGYALNHFELYATDLDAMRAFYTDVLGFVVTDEGGFGERRLVFLSRNPAEHHQLVLCSGRPAGAPNAVLNHVSFRVAELAALRAVLTRILGAPGGPHGAVEQITHGTTWSVYFRDPEQNRLECFVDTPWYTPQPFREAIDLTLPDPELRARTEAICRARPGFQPRSDWDRAIAAKFEGR